MIGIGFKDTTIASRSLIRHFRYHNYLNKIFMSMSVTDIVLLYHEMQGTEGWRRRAVLPAPYPNEWVFLFHDK